MGQISTIYQIWNNMLEVALEMPDVHKVITFCEVLFERQVALFDEYKS